MVAIPDCEEAVHLLQSQELGDGSEAVALFPPTVLMETTRGRVLGEGQALLADIAWELVHLFSRANPLRSSTLPEVVRFSCDGQAARPQRASVEAAAEQWIHEAMDEDTAADYVTVQGEDGGREPELMLDGDVVEDLQQRVRDLENMLAQQSRTPLYELFKRVADRRCSRWNGRLPENEGGEGGGQEDCIPEEQEEDPTKRKRLVLMLPPKILIRLGLVKEGEMWLVERALYGLRRESPKLWGDYRDIEISQMSFQANHITYEYQQSFAEENLWLARRKDSEDGDRVEGLALVYVDDVMLFGTRETVEGGLQSFRKT